MIVAILSYILPAGVYDTITDPETGNTVVDATSFHFVDRTPISPMDFLLSISKGLSANAEVIFFAFLVCGFFQIITDTGALDRLFGTLITRLGNKSYIVLPIFIVAMCLLGSTGMMLTPTVALIPVGLTLAKKLNVDPLFGVAVIYCCIYAGFGGSPYSPNSVVLAQNIADVDPMSGFGLRAILWMVVTIVTTWYLIRYAKKVQKDPKNSILGTFEFPGHQEVVSVGGKWTVCKDSAVAAAIFIGFGIYIYGALFNDWGLSYMNGIFFVVAVFSGLIGGLKANQIIGSFIDGCKNFVYGGLLIGLAGSISILMNEGQILHTIIYAMSIPLTYLPAALSAVLMYIIDLVCNFFIPSATGKAAVVMPLMEPLADVTGLTRQIAVSAYSMADSFGNTVIPTHAILISSLSIAKVPLRQMAEIPGSAVLHVVRNSSPVPGGGSSYRLCVIIIPLGVLYLRLQALQLKSCSVWRFVGEVNLAICAD